MLTGINFVQPSFGHCSAVNHPEQKCKVVTGYNLVGDKYSGTRQGPSPVAGGLPVSGQPLNALLLTALPGLAHHKIMHMMCYVDVSIISS